MKTVYPLITLFSAAFVAAGPVPIKGSLSLRDGATPARLIARTSHLAEPAPAEHPPEAAPAENVDAEAEAQKQAEEQAGKWNTEV